MSEEMVIGNYRFFKFEFDEENNCVVCFIERLDREDLKEEDRRKIAEIWDARGKWEAVSQTIRDIVGILGFVAVGTSFKDVYNLSTQEMPGIPRQPYKWRLFFHVKTEEHRKGRNASKEEIMNQLRNVRRWRSLIETVELLKPHLE